MYISHLLPSAGSATFPVFGLPSQTSTLESLFAVQPADKFAAGQGVVWEGDAVSDIFHIIDGCVRLYRILPDGRRAIIGFRFAGEMLGLACEGAIATRRRPSPLCGCAGSAAPACGQSGRGPGNCSRSS